VLASSLFTGSLQLGDNNQSVRQLQIFLNKDTETQVSSSGIGSAGNESTYFGNLTKLAVMRFQTKYRSDILNPSGLLSPTGFVGPATIKKINALMALNDAPVTSNKETQSLPTVSMPVISGISKISVSVGDTLVINGKFSGSSTVHFGDTLAVISKINSPTEIDAIVPSGSGPVLVWVGNEYGDSRADFPMFVVIGNVLSVSDLDKINAQNNIIHNKAINPANQ
jgi:peptidoglycan hydrolase-like protein with peptidoglycan-binding domain